MQSILFFWHVGEHIIFLEDLKMKKKLSIVTSAALLLSLGFTMAGCGKGVAKISPKVEGEYSATLAQNVIQANTANYTYEFGQDDNAGNVIVKEEVYNATLMTTTTTYKVFDLAANQFTSISSTTPLSVLDEGVFYTANETVDMSTGFPISTPNGTYTLFSTEGYSTPSAGKGSFSNHVFYAEDGSRWYVDVDGVLVQETDPFEMILVNANTEKLGKYYITTTSNGFNVFDKKGKFQDAFNREYTLGWTESMSLVANWSAGYNLFFQVATALPEYEEKYDFLAVDPYTNEMEKYNLDTYYYSIKNGKVKEVKNFDYLVESKAVTIDNGEDVVDYAILNVREIKNKRLSETTLVQSFGEKGKVYYDIQKLVPGAISINYAADGYTLIRDYAGFTYIYEKDDCALKIPAGSTSVKFADNGIVYYVVGETLYIYDLDSNSVIQSVNKVRGANTNNNGNIVFSTYDEIALTETYHIYNVDSLSESYSYTIDNVTKKIDSGSFSSSYVCVEITSTDLTTSLPVTTYTIMFPDSTISEIAGVADAARLGSYEVDNVEYTIFSTTMNTAGGFDPMTGVQLPASTIVSYHIGTEVYPTVKY